MRIYVFEDHYHLLSWATPRVREGVGHAHAQLDAAFAVGADRDLGAFDRGCGVMTPGGLGPAFRGPFDPYREALRSVHAFFPQVDAIERAFSPPGASARADMWIDGLWPHLHGSEAVHLRNAPAGAGELPASAINSYRNALQPFILFTKRAY